ncbi:MAG: tetratricopeptide repeat protein [bacterium]|nr:tetratricopeptide repeat protein [bacterium]
MKRLISALLAVSFLASAGCAYFNIFYNARRYYSRGLEAVEKERIQNAQTIQAAASRQNPGAAGKSDFQKAAEKSLKLLDYYPNSKYADDALLLLGKSYYYTQEYQMSLRRFQELLDRFPDSELRFDAELGMAKTYVALKQFDDADRILDRIVDQKVTKDQLAEAYYYQGRYFETRRDFAGAAEAFQKVVDLGSKSLGPEAQFAVEDNCDSLMAFDRSIEAYNRFLRMDPLPEMRFAAEFRLAVAMKNAGRADEAVRRLERLLGDEKNRPREPEMRLQIADALARKGDIDGSVTTYRDVIKLKEKSDYSAEAYYALGRLYETRLGDFTRAADNYSQVKKESARFRYADSAEVKARDILRMKALLEVVRLGLGGGEGDVVIEAAEKEAEEDSVDAFGRRIYAAVDSAIADSLVYTERILPDPALKLQAQEIQQRETRNRRDEPPEGGKSGRASEQVVDWRKLDDFELGDDEYGTFLDRAITERKRRADLNRLTENPELASFKKEETDKNLFLLAELYLFRFSMHDSAAAVYRRLTDLYPESPYAPQSRYNLRYILRHITGDSAAADSVGRRILADDPKSAFAKAVRRESGARSGDAAEDSVDAIFLRAEDLLLVRNRPAEAAALYRSIRERYPDSDAVPKALYAEAWVHENALNAPERAVALYDSLIGSHPGTPYAEKVKDKVQAAKLEYAKPKEPPREQRPAGLIQPVKAATTADSAGAGATAAPKREGALSPEPVPADSSGSGFMAPDPGAGNSAAPGEPGTGGTPAETDRKPAGDPGTLR